MTPYLVEYRTPYTNEVRTQEFANRTEAERMAAFYRSCGVKAGTRSCSRKSTEN